MPVIRKALVLSLLGTLPAIGSSPATQLPLDPAKNSGQSVTAAYEGWVKNEDGTYSLLVGYFNRNLEETLEIPVGPNNHIEPGGPDRGQPTHFLPRRQWGVFTIKVPADFAGKKLTWTLVANNQTTQVPMGLNPLWEVEPLRDAAQGNTPPVVRFDPQGKPFQGPPRGIAASLETTVSEPIDLTVWGKDDGVVNAYSRERDGPPLHLTWSKYRGPGEVSFDKAEPEIDESDGKATTTATFSEAGSYILRLQANDVSGDGGGGAQCCWTNVHVQVTVVDR
ncbi:MAG TPA: hypothetical protein VEK15_19865 [Vicinamibacteria bacterium]|nr:hypothetical protein [Vicinamibacteria bacterium]